MMIVIQNRFREVPFQCIHFQDHASIQCPFRRFPSKERPHDRRANEGNQQGLCQGLLAKSRASETHEGWIENEQWHASFHSPHCRQGQALFEIGANRVFQAQNAIRATHQSKPRSVEAWHSPLSQNNVCQIDNAFCRPSL